MAGWASSSSLSSCLGGCIGLTTWTGICGCLLYTSPSPRDGLLSRMPSSAWKKKLLTRQHKFINNTKYDGMQACNLKRQWPYANCNANKSEWPWFNWVNEKDIWTFKIIKPQTFVNIPRNMINKDSEDPSQKKKNELWWMNEYTPVSYTHLTLPTILLV